VITALIAGAITFAVHRAFRRSRLRTWMDLDDTDDRIGRLGEPRDDVELESDDDGDDEDDLAPGRRDDVLAPAGSSGISVVRE